MIDEIVFQSKGIRCMRSMQFVYVFVKTVKRYKYAYTIRNYCTTHMQWQEREFCEYNDLFTLYDLQQWTLVPLVGCWLTECTLSCFHSINISDLIVFP